MDMNHLIKQAHDQAKVSGWWKMDESGDVIRREANEICMLIVTEIAEATEAVRGANPPIYQVQGDSLVCPQDAGPNKKAWDKKIKPEGEAIELVDAVIRIADYFGSMRWAAEDGKFETDWFKHNPLTFHMELVREVAKCRGEDDRDKKHLQRVLHMIEGYFLFQGWDLNLAIRLKLDYNATRSYRHGGKLA